MSTNPHHIRNFSIIAHIDHGKSTLADRLIQATNGLSTREMQAQVLDSMDIERERGITIKAQTVRLTYKAKDGNSYQLNLMDTPGHVDFSYEVSRSLAACEGSLLVVDATQGVEAQTMANVEQAIMNNHEVLILLNKSDLPTADAERVCQQIENVIGLSTQNSLSISAKTGENIPRVLEDIVTKLPAPQGDATAPLKAIIVDSWYDAYLGVVVLTRIIDGVLTSKEKIIMMANKTQAHVDQIGVFLPKKQEVDSLSAGEIGFFTAGMKDISEARIGDTITEEKRPCAAPLPGFKPLQPVVFCGLFPVDSGQFEELRQALEKLRLNDAGFSFETETSQALGFGFRGGFLGLLHLEIIQERIIREFGIDVIATAPSVAYRVTKNDESVEEIANAADMPDSNTIAAIAEPWIEATIMVPPAYLGGVMELCEERRGNQKNLTTNETQAVLTYALPLSEVVFDFHDRLKSTSRGYASFDYKIEGYEVQKLNKLSILVNGEPVDALCLIVHQDKAENIGRALCKKLKESLPRHLFKIPIQAAIGGRIVARETVPAMRKDVTAKCYGGDISRKRKLLDKQKEGKKKMRRFGRVDIPQEAFLSALKLERD